jgi:hypothetical protein
VTQMASRPELSKKSREAAAKAGAALPNGKYPIRNRRELRAAIKLRHHSREPYPVVRSHILARAAALGIKIKASQVASAEGTEEFARSAKAQMARRRSAKSIGQRDPSLRWPHLYDILRAKGYSKEKSARIANSRLRYRKKGRLQGLPYQQADNPAALKRVLAESSRKSGRKSRTASALVAACYDKSCAPPPAGTGGSKPKSGATQSNGWARYPGTYIKGDYAITKNQGMMGGWDTWHKDAKGNPEEYRATIGGVKAKKISTQENLKVSQQAADAHAAAKSPVRGEFPVIKASEARGDSKPVSRAEFQRLANEGQDKLDAMSKNASPIKGLDDKWDSVKASSYEEVKKSWGGATIDSHTGEALPQGANRYALTVKEKGGETVSVPQGASKAEFDAAMDEAKERFRPILEREGHHLGVFHDDDLGRIDIDPVVVVDKLSDVHSIGAATRAIGGAYNFSDGNGYWPPHVAEEG